MGLGDLTDADAVRLAIREYDDIGADRFLANYGFGPARRYFLSVDGALYDSKAIAAAAHGYQFPDQGPLRADQFVGGLGSVVPRLRRLGFTIVDAQERDAAAAGPPALDVARVYSWEELGEMLGFEPGYLTRAGGMVSRPALGMLMLITHPGGARTIDYGDYWDGEDLIYTGHGQRGDQQRTGTNRDLGDNARTLHVFEQAGSRQLKYLGLAECADEWIARADDVDGNDRNVIRFRLQFQHGGRSSDTNDAPRADPHKDSAAQHVKGPRSARDVARTPRNFDPNRRPTPAAPRQAHRTPEQTAAEAEKAVQGHHDLLVALDARLRARGWTEIQEIPAAVDLWARDPQGNRVIFEAKTLAGSELERLRSAAIQLLEYRYFYGGPSDGLCIVTDRPVSDRQARFLSSLEVAIVAVDGEAMRAASPLARGLVTNIIDRDSLTKSQRADDPAIAELKRLHQRSFPSPPQAGPPQTSAVTSAGRRATSRPRGSDVTR